MKRPAPLTRSFTDKERISWLAYEKRAGFGMSESAMRADASERSRPDLEIRCQLIILARKDEPTPDYAPEPTPDYAPRKDEPTPDYAPSGEHRKIHQYA